MIAPTASRLDPFTIVSTNPGRNYEVVGEVRVSTAADIAVAVRQAHAALPAWQGLGVAGRVKAMEPVASLLEQHRQEIAEIVAREMAHLRRTPMARLAGCSIACAGLSTTLRRALRPR
jgi:acyl-CoA reductase-like NAD-dependent aldehyde dehydrogenase